MNFDPGVRALAIMAVGGFPRVKWLSDLDKAVLVSNFEKRGWAKGSSEGEGCCNRLRATLAGALARASV